MEKPFLLEDSSEPSTLTVTTPSSQNVILSATDLEGNPYYINGKSTFSVPVSEHGTQVPEIYIGASKSFYKKMIIN